MSHKEKEDIESINLQNIQIPVTPSKGRPKKSAKKPELYSKQCNSTKTKNLLTWLGIDDKYTQILLSGQGRKLEEEHVNKFCIRDTFLDKLVDVGIINKFFEEKAFQLFTTIISKKRKENKFICEICSKEALKDVVQCGSCRVWRHFQCELYDKDIGKYKKWFCSTCSQ